MDTTDRPVTVKKTNIIWNDPFCCRLLSSNNDIIMICVAIRVHHPFCKESIEPISQTNLPFAVIMYSLVGLISALFLNTVSLIRGSSGSYEVKAGSNEVDIICNQFILNTLRFA